MNCIEIIFFFVLFGVLGITAEVFVNSIQNFVRTRNKKLLGDSSIWMFFIYGSTYFIILFGTTYLMNLSIFIRGFIYMIMFYFLEFGTGFILKKFKAIPWDYSKNMKFNLKGIICLEFAIPWYLGGIILEFIYIYLKSQIIFL